VERILVQSDDPRKHDYFSVLIHLLILFIYGLVMTLVVGQTV
jgi:hypothetical protein